LPLLRWSGSRRGESEGEGEGEIEIESPFSGSTLAAEMMGSRWFVLLIAVAACRQPAEQRVTPTAPPSDARADASVAIGTLRASLVVEKPVVARIQDVRALVTLTNQSAGPWPVRTEFLTAGSLSLEVRELASGTHVSSGPPPMPAADRPGTFRTLAAGEAMTFTCNPAIAIDHAPGRFEVRFRGVPADPKNQDVVSGWVSFTVGP
jgi:hypothetical protein